MPKQLRAPFVFALALALSACPAPRKPEPTTPPVTQPPAAVSFPGATEHKVLAQESLIRILVFRGGTIANAGHNHVIASRNPSGTVYVHSEVEKSGFQIVMPVGDLIIDDPQLRAEEGADFAKALPDSARQGTRKNMLGETLLDAGRYPEITLTSVATTGTREQMQARTRVDVRGESHEITVPMSVNYEGQRVIATGEFPLKQTDLGLTPFSVMLGALQVQDEMKVKFRIVAERM
jgi:hypothetical protein